MHTRFNRPAEGVYEQRLPDGTLIVIECFPGDPAGGDMTWLGWALMPNGDVPEPVECRSFDEAKAAAEALAGVVARLVPA